MAISKMTVALRDIQARLARSKRLMALGKVAYSIAQYIRNLLASIWTVWPVGTSGKDTTAETFAEIIAGAGQLEHWVSNLLTHLRPLHQHRSSCDLNQLSRNALAALEQRIAAKAVQPVLQLSPLPSVAADPLWMEQAFLAILTNAIEASPHGGRLTIRSFEDSRGVTVAMADEGKGMPPAILEKVFDPYFTTKSGGLGLGLTVAKKIVEAHQGRIELHSDEGRGTTVRVHIPSYPGRSIP
jgi:two-component system, NtrC family, sensor histidine kinase HydH